MNVSHEGCNGNGATLNVFTQMEITVIALNPHQTMRNVHFPAMKCI